MFWSTADPFFSPYDMSDLHHVVVHNIRSDRLESRQIFTAPDGRFVSSQSELLLSTRR